MEGREASVVFITKRVEFCAAHRYQNPAWSDEENRRVFGKCWNPSGHGHNYILEVTVAGRPAPETGMVMDLKALKDLIAEVVIEQFDHKHLNLDVPYFKEKIPTTENLAVVIWELLEPRIARAQASLGRGRSGPAGDNAGGEMEGCRLHRIRLHEDQSFSVDYYGEAA